MVVLLIGQQGTGKSTLGRALEARVGGCFISGGEVIREEIARKSLTGRRIKARIERGERAHPRTAYRLLRREMRRREEPYFLDGFPSTVQEVGRLERLCNGAPDRVLLLDGPPIDELVDRIRTRLECSACRRPFGAAVPPPSPGRCYCGEALIQRAEDDDAEKIEKRHLFWTRNRRPIHDHFLNAGVVARIDARNPPSKVLDDALDVLSRDGLAPKST